jgi:hypothetical protein
MMTELYAWPTSKQLSWCARIVLCLGIVLVTNGAVAEVVDLKIDRHESFAEGKVFGASGAYEKLTGSIWIEVTSSHPANRHVVDLDLAPMTVSGKVRFRTDFFLLKPVDTREGSRRLLYDVNNRGNKLALAAFNGARSNNPTTLADAGNGFLMRQGYSILWCGWNGDVMPGDNRLLIDLPVARETSPGGTRPITAKVYSEIRVDKPSFSEPLCWGNTKVYPTVDVNDSEATLTMRPRRSARPIGVPRDQWSFARWEDGSVIPDSTHLYVKEGFCPGWLYDLVYTAKDPRVSGLGAVAVRDVVSFLRYARQDRKGRPNPLAEAIDHAYVFGISQSGRFINHFLYRDFNGDEEGRTVFDGAFIDVGGTGKAIFNRRFAQITRHGSQHEENLFPSDIFPFTTLSQHDPVTGQRGDFLERSRRSGHLPRIVVTQTSTEYWGRGGSLLHTDVEGKRDVPLDPNVRLYHIAGAHHLFFTPKDRGPCQYPLNTMNYVPLFRSLLVILDEWVADGREPPQSRYPRIADGTLVELETYRRSFPRIPDVTPPESVYAPLRLDLGPRWETKGIADYVPPRTGEPYRTLVPAVDADGNEIAGVRMPDVAVPLSTHVGWNQRAAEFGAEGMLARWVGSSWPLPATREQCQRDDDPRVSLAERYPTKEAYMAKLDQAVEQLKRERFLLEEDSGHILESAASMPLWRSDRE